MTRPTQICAGSSQEREPLCKTHVRVSGYSDAQKVAYNLSVPDETPKTNFWFKSASLDQQDKGQLAKLILFFFSFLNILFSLLFSSFPFKNVFAKLVDWGNSVYLAQLAVSKAFDKISHEIPEDETGKMWAE